jgi:ubiquinone/menaquinone biosynthesis C-methylase UbiE
MRRVLRPGGRLLFCEHGVAPDAGVRKWQDRINPAWRRFAGGCNVNRDIPALLEAAGFRTLVDERMYLPGFKLLSYNYWGSAVAD